ncbi:glutaminyl-tRNA synthetase-like [Dorcoceras hygrometricum]|uniref:glutamine--tRNA ligase n=1 Tax=Dorcoceras hygrometricum TaxID=472368 RepID=A0A2Z7BUH8_9LAMI|nr:glutaminyl-tRNA synthetase-like [Dorcoceras hygrometricum]
MVKKEDGGIAGEKALDLFLKIGLDERTAENTIANNKVTANLTAVIHEAAVTDGCDRAVGNLLYTVATKFPSNSLVHRPTLLKYIVSSKVKSPAQLEAAFSFLAATASDSFKIDDFEAACGVGVETSTEDIEVAVDEIFEEKKSIILEQRYRTNVGELFSYVRKKHPWADPKIVKASIQIVDAKLHSILGERTAADDEKPVKKKKDKTVKAEDKTIHVVTPPQKPSEEEINPFSIFPSPLENFKVHTEIYFSDRPILRAFNSKEILEKHLKVTGGKVFTRFPPEPNGYLHIGHAKAMFVDFGLAKERGGCCYLRYDDTNPEAEKKEYIDHIEEIVGWMGWEPFKITYTSDYFQELYELAVALIRRGHAYVDHQTPDEIKEYREKKINSPWRGRPVEESLKLFDDMKRGMIEEGKATLRMKQDMQSDNFNMYDLIAYRIKAILCTLEFETRRASYYWLLDALSLYQPYVWEYARLNITNTVMSKRKLNRLVTEKWVDGWDDPRLMTLAGLRRRGVTATSINAFVRGIGITRSDCSIIRLDRLEYHVREELNKTAPRTMVVLNPLKVVITNMEASVIDIDAKKWPDAPEDDASSFYKIPYSSVVYIEHSDFRMKDSKDYYGLAPGKSVLLRYAFPIKCTEVILGDDNTTILEVHAEYDPAKKSKPKGVLHWVSESSPGVNPLMVEVRLFDKLFNSENPALLENWLGDLNPQSKLVISDAYAVSSLKDAAIGDRFQFERLGYFAVDKDSLPEKLVFNRIVTLRDSFGKIDPATCRFRVRIRVRETWNRNRENRFRAGSKHGGSGPPQATGNQMQATVELTIVDIYSQLDNQQAHANRSHQLRSEPSEISKNRLIQQLTEIGLSMSKKIERMKAKKQKARESHVVCHLKFQARIQEAEDSMQAQHLIIEALVEEKDSLLQTIQGLQEANDAPAPLDDEWEEEPEERPEEEEIPIGDGEIDDK